MSNMNVHVFSLKYILLTINKEPKLFSKNTMQSLGNYLIFKPGALKKRQGVILSK